MKKAFILLLVILMTFSMTSCDLLISGLEAMVTTTAHVHNPVVVPSKAPTCTEEGYTAECYCSSCGEVLVEKTILPAIGHTEVAISATPPTCTAVGWDAYVACSRCDYTTYREKAALGHDEEFHDAKTPTCTEVGWDAYVACSRCDYTTYQEKAVKHIYKNKVCKECGAKQPCQGLEFTSNGDGTCYVSGIGSCIDTEVVIPSVSYAGDTVTAIGGSAFLGCSEIKSITIPASVASIYESSVGLSPFTTCTSLLAIEVANDNPSYQSIDGNLYTKDGKTLLRYAGGKTATEFTIPSTVESIGAGAFRACRTLATIIIPASVTSIGEVAFVACTFASITIPASVTSIGEYAFSNCPELTSIEVANDNPSYQSIDGNLYAKDGKTLLRYPGGKTATAFTVPSTVESIGAGAFSQCYALTSVTISASVMSIGDSAFMYCSHLRTINYRGTEEEWAAIEKGSNWQTSNPTVVYNYSRS